MKNKNIISLLTSMCIASAFTTPSVLAASAEQYSINVTNGAAYNSASTQITSASAGDIVTITPEDGGTYHSFSQWSSSDVSPVASSDGKSATFTMPEKSVSVEAVYSPPLRTAQKYDDVTVKCGENAVFTAKISKTNPEESLSVLWQPVGSQAYLDDSTSSTDTVSYTMNNVKCSDSGTVIECVVLGSPLSDKGIDLDSKLTVTPHSDTWISTDPDNHWQICECGAKFNESEHLDGNADGKCDTCGHDMSINAVVSAVSVNGITEPVADVSPDFNIYGFSLGSANYMIENIQWIDKASNAPLSSSSKFEAGKAYTLKLIIKKSENASFAENADNISVTLNGKAAESKALTDSNTRLAVTLSFEVPNTVKEPVISPDNTTFRSSVRVTIGTQTENTQIYYTTDGSTPTKSSIKYTEPFTISSTTTVKAIAVKTGMDNSSVVTSTLTRRTSTGGLDALSYMVRFNSNGGSAVPNQIIKMNNTVRKPSDPTKSGYTFAGWYSDEELRTRYDFDSLIKKDVTLYAKWVVGDYNDDTSVANSGNSTGGTVTVPTGNNTIVLTIDSKRANVYGQYIMNDVAPIVRNDRTMLPARFVAEALGAKVEWNQEKLQATISNNTTKIVITIGSYTAEVNGKRVMLDSPAFVENNRTYTPIRFISEQLGADVQWNDTEKTVTIIP